MECVLPDRTITCRLHGCSWRTLAAEDGDTHCAWVSWVGSQPQQGADSAHVCVLRVTLPAGPDAQVRFLD